MPRPNPQLIIIVNNDEVDVWNLQRLSDEGAAKVLVAAANEYGKQYSLAFPEESLENLLTSDFFPSNKAALETLAEEEGYPEVTKFLERLMMDPLDSFNSMCLDCGCAGNMEPDQDAGHCHDCGGSRVQHAFILAGVI